METIAGFDPEMWARARRCWLAAPRFNGSTARELRGAAYRNMHRAWNVAGDRCDAPPAGRRTTEHNAFSTAPNVSPGFSRFNGGYDPRPDSVGDTTSASIQGRPGGDPRRTVGRDSGNDVAGGAEWDAAASDAPGSPNERPPGADPNHPGNRAVGRGEP